MDPNANLQKQLSLAEGLVEQAEEGDPLDPDDALRLAQLVIALNGWIEGGGFLPARWKR